jgi:uncharacterized coiled-coil protein SlyX
MSSPELSRRVGRQEEDLQAISDTVLEIKDVVDGHTTTLTQHGQDLAEIKTTLIQHGQDLAEIKTTQAQQGTALAEQGRQLGEILTLLRERG